MLCTWDVAGGKSSNRTPGTSSGASAQGGARLFVPFRDGKPAGEPIDFATGFLTEDGKARGRPVGVTVDPRGALIVADDLANTVWRIAASQPAGAATQPVGAATEPADEAPSAEEEPAQNP